MQNISPVQTHPDTLIKNFYMAGVTQAQLKEEITNKSGLNDSIISNVEIDKLKFAPKTIFSLYEEHVHTDPLAKRVFPDGFRVKKELENTQPKFFSFMHQDRKGLMHYNHCLIFHEHVKLEKIFQSPQSGSHIEKLAQQRRLEIQPWRKQNQERQGNLLQDFGKKGVNRHADSLMKKKKEASSALPDRGSEANSESFSSRFGTEQSTVQLMSKNNSDGSEESKINPLRKQLSANHRKLVQLLADGDKIPLVQDSLAQVEKNVDFPDRDDSVSRIDAYQFEDSLKNMPSQQKRGNVFYNVSGDLSFQESQLSRQITGYFNHNILMKKDTGDSTVQNLFQPQQQDFYVPVAWVIETDIEHHDIFKEVLKTLFELIRKPLHGFEESEKNMELAYSEFLTHLAFLASIPCPTFNTRFKIQFVDKELIIVEPKYTDLPNKNQDCIQLLYKLLEPRTILYCWKALLFDYKLVLMSSNYSSQFQIAQALLQLLYPLAYQNGYKAPIGDDDKRIYKTRAIMITCSENVKDFEMFEQLNEKKFLKPEDKIALCDIDSGYTNNLPFPEFENERKFLQDLNKMIKRNDLPSDNIFEEQPSQGSLGGNDQKDVTLEYREKFFEIMNRFLAVLKDEHQGPFFRDREDGHQLVFASYFDQAKYLDHFGGSDKDLAFASLLIKSQNFVTFCDDWQSQEFSNAVIYMNSDKRQPDTDDLNTLEQLQFDERINKVKSTISESFIIEERQSRELRNNRHGSLKESQKRHMQQRQEKPDEKVKLKLNHLWPEDEVFEVIWRIPKNNQRVMIYEKLLYAIQEVEQLRKQQDDDAVLCLTGHEEQDQKCACNHQDQVKKAEQMITIIKKQYEQVLPKYCDQLIKAKIIPPNQNPCIQSWSSDQFARTRLPDAEESKARLNSGGQSSMLQGLGKQISLGTEGFLQGIGRRETAAFPRQARSALNEASDKEDGMAEEDSEQKKAEKREINRIVEFSYGQSGLIEFLDLLFSLFPDKKRINANFNYYFGIKKQFEAIEGEIKQALEAFYIEELKRSQARQRQAPLQSRQRQAPIQQNPLSQTQKQPDHAIIMINSDEQINVESSNSNSENLTRSQRQTNRIIKGQSSNLDLELNIDDFFRGQLYIADRRDSAQKSIMSNLIHRQSEQERDKGILCKEPSKDSGAPSLPPSLDRKYSQPSNMTDIVPPTVDDDPSQPPSSVYNGIDGPNQLDIEDSLIQENLQGERTEEELANSRKLRAFGDDKDANSWMLPKIPDKLRIEGSELQAEEEKYMDELQKLIAFRRSYQYIGLKQKLYFAFEKYEDLEEAIQRIYSEFFLYQDRDRLVFPEARFDELLDYMSVAQKDRIFKELVEKLYEYPIKPFQMKLMHKHQTQDDRDGEHSLDDKFFAKDFLKEIDPRGENQTISIRTIQRLAQQGYDWLRIPRDQKFMQLADSDRDSMRVFDSHSSTSMIQSVNASAMHDIQEEENEEGSQTSVSQDLDNFVDQLEEEEEKAAPQVNRIPARRQPQPIAIVQNQDALERDNSIISRQSRKFGMEKHVSIISHHSLVRGISNTTSMTGHDANSFVDTDKTLEDADHNVQKLLQELLTIYGEYFNQVNFDEHKQDVRDQKSLYEFQEKLWHLRVLEDYLLGQCHINSSTDNQYLNVSQRRTKEQQETEKQCFWINLFNYKLLQKMMEVLATEPKTLSTRLQSCTMIVGLLCSIQIFVNSKMLSLFEIFKTMLRNTEVQFMQQPFEAPYRRIEEMPAELQCLALDESKPFAKFGLFLPVDKWTNLEVFQHITKDNQMVPVIQNAHFWIQSDPKSFLMRVPRFFLKQLPAEASQFESLIGKSESVTTQKDQIFLRFKNFLENDNFDKQKSLEIRQLLHAINSDKNAESHLFDVCSLHWRFDIMTLHARVKPYCMRRGLWRHGKEIQPDFRNESARQAVKNDLAPIRPREAIKVQKRDPVRTQSFGQPENRPTASFGSTDFRPQLGQSEVRSSYSPRSQSRTRLPEPEPIVEESSLYEHRMQSQEEEEKQPVKRDSYENAGHVFIRKH